MLNSAVVEALEPYYDDPVGFAHDVVGYEPTWQQAEFMMDVASNRMVTVASGHGIGKTRAEATLAWWFLLTRPKSIVPCTAPSSHQLYDILWKELIWVKSRLPPAFADSFDYSSKRIWHKAFKEQWFLQAVTARADKPESIQGFHGEHLLFLIEEAGGVVSEIFETVEGALTHPDNRILLVGNPTRSFGYFYDSHHGHKDEWAHRTYSSLDSPLYDAERGHSLRRRYGSHSNVYKIRVLGQFPGAEPDQLIPTTALEAAIEVEVDEKSKFPIIWALDVARYGDDESVLARRHGREVLPLHGWRQFNTTQLARAVSRVYTQTPMDLRPQSIVIDTNGIGAGVYDVLEKKGYPVVEFMAQWKSSDPSHYANIKAEVYDRCADWIKAGKLKLPYNDAQGERDDELIAQGTTVKFRNNEKSGKWEIVGKTEMKDKHKVLSPDRFEAVVYTFYDDDIRDTIPDDDDIPDIEAEDRDTRNGYDYDEFDMYKDAA